MSGAAAYMSEQNCRRTTSFSCHMVESCSRRFFILSIVQIKAALEHTTPLASDRQHVVACRSWSTTVYVTSSSIFAASITAALTSRPSFAYEVVDQSPLAVFCPHDASPQSRSQTVSPPVPFCGRQPGPVRKFSVQTSVPQQIWPRIPRDLNL